MTLSSIVLSMDWPMRERPTGWAAPVFVPGAMAKMSQATPMKKPAEAARAPPGAT